MNNDKRFKDSIEAANALRDLIAEARGMKKDLEKIIKEAKREAVEEAKEYIHGQVTIQLKQLGKQTEEAIAKSVARVERKFDELYELFMTGGDRKGERIEKMVENYVNKNGPMVSRVRDPSKIKKLN